ncbi:polysaccharide deacetylase family protein [Bifidobacterium stellenboschense]|uniref:polysaccharide deacetylase family protein n=1 Tax=Bifidobacterium stellenboschense TaxID=762211 RepID=UPI0012EC410C|nr:polysaccharide deacetylase family protein [Bifidobacterium stellenboschense]
MLLLVGAVAAAYRPAYDYYRRAIADCIEWSNSYALSVQRFRGLADEATKVIKDDVPSVVPRLRAEVDADAARTPALFGASGCAARQWPGALHDKAERFRALTSRSEARIAAVHKASDALMDERLARYPQAIAAARAQLSALVAGVEALHDATTKTALDEARALLAGGSPSAGSPSAGSSGTGSSGTGSSSTGPSSTGSSGTMPSDISDAPRSALADYRRAREALLDAADTAVKAANRARGIDCEAASSRCIALTFDDGPNAVTTPQVLDALERAVAAQGSHEQGRREQGYQGRQGRGARATFFAVGGSVTQDTRQLLARANKDGFPYGSHTWSHVDLPQIMASGAQHHELDDASAVIAQASGRPVNLIRPPHGALDEPSRAYAEGMGAGLALYDVDSYDWSVGANAHTVKEKVLAQVRPGSIVLLHDIQPHTAAVLPELLDELRARGYEFVTIPELTGEYPRPGAVYYARDNILRM